MSIGTGIGSWPGVDARTAVRAVRDLLAEDGLPYLPELPARGPGGDIVGRAAGLLVALPVDLQPGGWRLVDRPGRDAGRTAALWRQDLDELAEAYDGYRGRLKVQVAGPWTLAASLWLPRGERVVVDPGACRDLVASLAEGVAGHLAAVRAMVPGAELVLQLDEPSLPTVLAGRLPTASGLGVLRAVEPEAAAAGLRQVVDAVLGLPGIGGVAVHCCAADVPWRVLRSVGATALSVDSTRWDDRAWEPAAEAVEAGLQLWAGCLPATIVGAGTLDVPAAVRALAARWRQVGLPLRALAEVTVSPACGLADSDPDQARSLQRHAAGVARALTEHAQS